MSVSELLSRLFDAGVWTGAATILLLLAGGVNYLLRGRLSASLRHLTWLAAFCALLLTPVLAAIIPARIFVRPTVVSPPTPAPVSAAPYPEADLTGVTAVSAPASSVTAIAPRLSQLTVARLLPWLWAAGAAAVLMQAVCGVLMTMGLRRRSLPLPLTPDEGFDPAALAARIGVKRRWELRVSTTDAPTVPLTCGILRPAVLLPRDARSWPIERRDAVLLHELAHIRRGDTLTQSIALGVCALFWFHPLVWRAARALRAEAEAAADDAVLLSGVRASDYAAHLLWFAGRCALPGRIRLAAAGVSLMRDSQLKSRILAIVSGSAHRQDVTGKEAGVALLTVVCAVAALVCIRPRPAFSELRERGRGGVTLPEQQPGEAEAPPWSARSATRTVTVRISDTVLPASHASFAAVKDRGETLHTASHIVTRLRAATLTGQEAPSAPAPAAPAVPTQPTAPAVPPVPPAPPESKKYGNAEQQERAAKLQQMRAEQRLKMEETTRQKMAVTSREVEEKMRVHGEKLRLKGDEIRAKMATIRTRMEAKRREMQKRREEEDRGRRESKPGNTPAEGKKPAFLTDADRNNLVVLKDLKDIKSFKEFREFKGFKEFKGFREFKAFKEADFRTIEREFEFTFDRLKSR